MCTFPENVRSPAGVLKLTYKAKFPVQFSFTNPEEVQDIKL